MTTKREKELARKEAFDKLRAWIHPEDTIYTVLRHVSRSGESRDITVLIPVGNEIVNVSYYVADLLDWSMNRERSAVKVSGCGMDMGWHLVYTLSRALFTDDEQPEKMKLHPMRQSDCGYWLTQRWL